MVALPDQGAGVYDQISAARGQILNTTLNGAVVSGASTLTLGSVTGVVVGGSLIQHGGQNPIEAIKLGASIVHGPHVFNFVDVYEALDGAGGAKLAQTQEALVKQLGQLLADPAARNLVVAAAERVVSQLGGALDRTLAALEPYILQLRLEMGAQDA